MEARLESVIPGVIDGTNKFFVPPYQRPYKWEREHVDAFIDDIRKSAQDNEKEYFIGSIICVKPNSNSERFEIVDGQQRLITLTLILLEISKILKDKEPKNSNKLRSFVMQEEDFGGKNKITPTLRVRKEDDVFYQKHILDDGDATPLQKTSSEKTFVANREAIRKKLGDMQDSEFEQFTKHLWKNLKVVFVQTDDLISSYRLFNVLNDRGLELAVSDLIKNELLFAVHDQNDGREQAKTVERNWRKMEKLVGEDKLDHFLSLHVVSEKQDRDRAKDRMRHAYFNKKLKSLNGNSVKISETLLHSSENRDSFLRGDFSKEERIRFLKRFAKPSDWEPAFMAFLNRSDLRERFRDFVHFFEKVYMHCFLGGGKGDAACYYAVEAINNGKEYGEILDHIAVLEQNEALEMALDRNNFYVRGAKSNASSSKTVKAILLRIEDARRDESFTADYNLGNITLEHILPQKMSNPYWKEQGFSSEIHEEWCHKLGNLTLLLHGSNARAQNFGFDEKKKAYQKPNKKLLDITKDVCDFSEWNLDALETRHERLKKELLDLWRITEVPQKTLLGNR